MRTRVIARFPFTSFPAGWFRVAHGDELRRGAVKALHYFGQDLVLFRTRHGVPHLLDAHCPHLGAHLGFGGTVIDDAIRCGFHGWQMDGTGSCIAIPYGQRIPPRAAVRSWPVREVNGVIMAYHAARGEAQPWDFAALPEYADAAWTPFFKANRWRICTHLQEVGENGVDNAHFGYLHTQQTKTMKTHDVVTEGPVFIHRTHQVYNLFRFAKRWLSSEVSGPLDITCYGLGCVVNRALVEARIRPNIRLCFLRPPSMRSISSSIPCSA